MLAIVLAASLCAAPAEHAASPGLQQELKLTPERPRAGWQIALMSSGYGVAVVAGLTTLLSLVLSDPCVSRPSFFGGCSSPNFTWGAASYAALTTAVTGLVVGTVGLVLFGRARGAQLQWDELNGSN